MKVAVLITGQLRDYQVNALNQIKHLIEPNNADVFVYACNKNTLHTTGNKTTQKYAITTVQAAEEIEADVKQIYGESLKGIQVNEAEELDDSNFGTLGYFRKRMQNQMNNIRNGYLMAMEYAQAHGFEYDVIVRSRPDNAIYPNPIDLKTFQLNDGLIHSTRFYTGWADPWFFAFGTPETFDTYCSFQYMEGEDGARTDNDFLCPERAMERYLPKENIFLRYHVDICLPFTGFDKEAPIREFPYRNESAQLIDRNGNKVVPKLK